jgi:replication factor C subunit 3/5
MRIGSKKIFHLEAWVVKAMSITKHHLLGMALSDSDDFNDF